MHAFATFTDKNINLLHLLHSSSFIHMNLRPANLVELRAKFQCDRMHMRISFAFPAEIEIMMNVYVSFATRQYERLNLPRLRGSSKEILSVLIYLI